MMMMLSKNFYRKYNCRIKLLHLNLFYCKWVEVLFLNRLNGNQKMLTPFNIYGCKMP